MNDWCLEVLVKLVEIFLAKPVCYFLSPWTTKYKSGLTLPFDMETFISAIYMVWEAL
jgi:hypothetical protein